MTAVEVDTRYDFTARCDDGHAVSVFYLIIGGEVYSRAVIVHSDPDDGPREVFIAPAELREWIEGDHELLHRVGHVVGQSMLELVGVSNE
jgi:hypothetical protein